MFPAHLEGILLAADGGVEIGEAIAEFSGADVANPGGDVIAAEILAVMAVHEVVLHARIGAGRSDWVCCAQENAIRWCNLLANDNALLGLASGKILGISIRC